MSNCPFRSSVNTANEHKEVIYDFWPDELNISALHKNNPLSNPMDNDFNYKHEFESLNLDEVKKDLKHLLTDSQSWWPADFGTYGPFFVRLAWHSAGTYRATDGKGGSGDGTIRYPPLNSWPDNGNLDKARRILWPIKQKYGKKISWADLFVLVGNVALESMGFKILGFAGGRVDVWEPDKSTYWGSEEKMLENKNRYSKGTSTLEKPLAATNMGLIYVNPEGPNGKPNPVAAAHDIRTTFGRMGMNDEETVALIAGGHTIGKCHGAANTKYAGPEPEAAPIEQMGLGWKNSYRSGNASNTITSGLEVTWTKTPTKFSMDYLENLFEYDWKLTKSPAGAYQWIATNAKREIPDAFDPSKKHFPTMLTTDLSLRYDKSYRKISKMFINNPEKFKDAFAAAWFKLTHRDMGPSWRYFGSDIPKEVFIWQDPIPARNHPLVSSVDIDTLKNTLLASNLTKYDLIITAWRSASSYRCFDYRGGSNGARITLEPQKSWPYNEPQRLTKIIDEFKRIQTDFNNKKTNGVRISLADLITIGAAAAIEATIKGEGKNIDIKIPLRLGRMDAIQEQTDIASFNLLQPQMDPFINYNTYKSNHNNNDEVSEKYLIKKAEQLGLTASQMVVLLGGLRSLGIVYKKTSYGVLTEKSGFLTTDFFKNILDVNIIWVPYHKNKNLFIGKNRNTGESLWKATRSDLILGSNSILRAYTEVYATNDVEKKFYKDFIESWNIVMNANLPPT
jgi:catalase-peroxidase